MGAGWKQRKERWQLLQPAGQLRLQAWITNAYSTSLACDVAASISRQRAASSRLRSISTPPSTSCGCFAGLGTAPAALCMRYSLPHARQAPFHP